MTAAMLDDAGPPGIALERLSRYFADHVPGSDGELTAELIQGGRSNLTYLIGEGAHRWVVRRPPLGTSAPTANDVVREYRAMHALQASTVPVPPTVALCEDASVIGAPFCVVGYVEGVVIRTPAQAAALTAEDAYRCGVAVVQEMARLHSVPPGEVGLDRFGRPEGFVARQVDRWRRQWEVVSTREISRLERLHERLAGVVPPSTRAGIVHGDFRLDNTILSVEDVGTVAAVVDWEMSTLGDPLVDLGILLAYWDPVVTPLLGHGHAPSANPGFPSADEVLQRYFAGNSADGDDIAFYLALAFFKLAVIAEGIHRRFREGLTVGDGFETVGTAVEPLVERGLDVLEGGPRS